MARSFDYPPDDYTESTDSGSLNSVLSLLLAFFRGAFLIVLMLVVEIVIVAFTLSPLIPLVLFLSNSPDRAFHFPLSEFLISFPISLVLSIGSLLFVEKLIGKYRV